MKRLTAAVTALAAVVAGILTLTADPARAETLYGWLQSQFSYKAVVVLNASKTAGAEIVQYPHTIAAPLNDEWRFVLFDTPMRYRIYNQHSGMCLVTKNASLDSGAAVIQWPCSYDGTHNDVWQLVKVPYTSDSYRILNLRSSKCLNIKGASKDNYARLIQYTCSTNDGTTLAKNDWWIPWFQE